MQLDITAISTLLGLASVIIGIAASLSTIRRFAKARELSIFLEFLKMIYDKEFIKDMNEVFSWSWESMDEFFQKYGADPDDFAKWTRVGSYFDGLAKIVEKKLVNYTFIPETTAISIITFYEKFQPWEDQFDVIMRRKDVFGSIRRLYNRLHKLDHPHPHPQTNHLH